MPSDSEQRSPPPSYRGCWHGVSRGFLWEWSSQRVLAVGYSCSLTGVYNPKAFFLHAASLGQACAHCQRFSTAASRRSLGSVSVPVCGITLSGPVPVVALVGRYPTNKLIGLGSLPKCKVPKDPLLSSGRDASTGSYAVLIHLSVGCPPLRGRLSKHYSPFRTLISNRSPISRATCMPYPRRQRSF